MVQAITSLGLFMMSLPHFLTGHRHLAALNTTDTALGSTQQDTQVRNICKDNHFEISTINSKFYA